MTNMIRLIDEIKVGNNLGESVIWDKRDQSLWWTDIMGNKIYHLGWPDKKLSVYETPERVCSIGLTQSIDTLIIAFETGVCLYVPKQAKQKIDWIFRPFDTDCGIRFNDGRIDRQGRFWVSTMIEDEQISSNNGHLYSVDCNRKVTDHLSNFKIGNSLAWVPDSSRMFFSDSSQQIIWSFDFDATTGKVSAQQTFCKTAADEFPDGADVDSFGNLWCSNWGGHSISVYDKNGTQLNRFSLPVSQPTCLAFGGENMDLLFVTSATYLKTTKQLRDETSAGNLLIYKTDCMGIAAPQFGENNV